MVLAGINRIAWSTKLLLMAVRASHVDSISLCHILKAQHCSLSPNGCFNPTLAPHPTPSPTLPLPAHPPPVDSIQELSQNPAAFK